MMTSREALVESLENVYTEPSERDFAFTLLDTAERYFQLLYVWSEYRSDYTFKVGGPDLTIGCRCDGNVIEASSTFREGWGYGFDVKMVTSPALKNVIHVVTRVVVWDCTESACCTESAT